jgi:viroplasmin and RNaseH domain-containing protein
MGFRFYAVSRGRETGVYTSWGKVVPLVHNFPGAIYQGFDTEEAAISFLLETGLHLVSSSSPDLERPYPVTTYLPSHSLSKWEEKNTRHCCCEENMMLKNKNDELIKEIESLKQKLRYISNLGNQINDLCSK